MKALKNLKEVLQHDAVNLKYLVKEIQPHLTNANSDDADGVDDAHETTTFITADRIVPDKTQEDDIDINLINNSPTFKEDTEEPEPSYQSNAKEDDNISPNVSNSPKSLSQKIQLAPISSTLNLDVCCCF